MLHDNLITRAQNLTNAADLPGLAAQIATAYAMIAIADQLDAIRKHLNTP